MDYNNIRLSFALGFWQAVLNPIGSQKPIRAQDVRARRLQYELDTALAVDRDIRRVQTIEELSSAISAFSAG
jgi:hypothetical protein